jgi:hypothetical protein
MSPEDRILEVIERLKSHRDGTFAHVGADDIEFMLDHLCVALGELED